MSKSVITKGQSVSASRAARSAKTCAALVGVCTLDFEMILSAYRVLVVVVVVS